MPYPQRTTEVFRNSLGELDWTLNAPEPICAMYHAGTGPDSKKIVQTHLSLPTSQSRLRVVFSTSALALGVNTSWVQQVFHFLPPRRLEDYVQQCGRAGRDADLRDLSLPVVLYYSPMSLRTCAAEMVSYCNDEAASCRRAIIFKHASPQHTFAAESGPCCDLCAADSPQGAQQPV